MYLKAAIWIVVVEVYGLSMVDDALAMAAVRLQLVELPDGEVPAIAKHHWHHKSIDHLHVAVCLLLFLVSAEDSLLSACGTQTYAHTYIQTTPSPLSGRWDDEKLHFCT